MISVHGDRVQYACVCEVNHVQKEKVVFILFCYVFYSYKLDQKKKIPKGFHIGEFQRPGQLQDSLPSFLYGPVIMPLLGYRVRDRCLKQSRPHSGFSLFPRIMMMTTVMTIPPSFIDFKLFSCFFTYLRVRCDFDSIPPCSRCQPATKVTSSR